MEGFYRNIAMLATIELFLDVYLGQAHRAAFKMI